MNFREEKAGITAFFAAVSALLGWFGWLVVLYVGCMAIDWITGSAAAGKNNEWKSETAREGIWHKVGSILSVLVAAGADLLVGLIINNIPGIVIPFSYSVLICPIVIVWYILTELGSIIENAGKMGAPIPEFLKRMISIFKQTTEATGDKLISEQKEKK